LSVSAHVQLAFGPLVVLAVLGSFSHTAAAPHIEFVWVVGTGHCSRTSAVFRPLSLRYFAFSRHGVPAQ
jgi:hypothetical protein